MARSIVALSSALSGEARSGADQHVRGVVTIRHDSHGARGSGKGQPKSTSQEFEGGLTVEGEVLVVGAGQSRTGECRRRMPAEKR